MVSRVAIRVGNRTGSRVVNPVETEPPNLAAIQVALPVVTEVARPEPLHQLLAHRELVPPEPVQSGLEVLEPEAVMEEALDLVAQVLAGLEPAVVLEGVLELVAVLPEVKVQAGHPVAAAAVSVDLGSEAFRKERTSMQDEDRFPVRKTSSITYEETSEKPFAKSKTTGPTPEGFSIDEQQKLPLCVHGDAVISPERYGGRCVICRRHLCVDCAGEWRCEIDGKIACSDHSFSQDGHIICFQHGWWERLRFWLTIKEDDA